MIPIRIIYKTCNADYFRQSSAIRAASGQAGMISASSTTAVEAGVVTKWRIAQRPNLSTLACKAASSARNLSTSLDASGLAAGWVAPPGLKALLASSNIAMLRLEIGRAHV